MCGSWWDVDSSRELEGKRWKKGRGSGIKYSFRIENSAVLELEEKDNSTGYCDGREG